MAINKVIYGGNTLIDLTGDTVTAADLAYGVKAHDNSGAQITGTSTKDSDTSDATAQVAEILATKTGQPLDKILKDTDRDFYMTAQEAKDYGIIDNILIK